jgi:hypothetical protein
MVGNTAPVQAGEVDNEAGEADEVDDEDDEGDEGTRSPAGDALYGCRPELPGQGPSTASWFFAEMISSRVHGTPGEVFLRRGGVILRGRSRPEEGA